MTPKVKNLNKEELQVHLNQTWANVLTSPRELWGFGT